MFNLPYYLLAVVLEYNKLMNKINPGYDANDDICTYSISYRDGQRYSSMGWNITKRC